MIAPQEVYTKDQPDAPVVGETELQRDERKAIRGRMKEGKRKHLHAKAEQEKAFSRAHPETLTQRQIREAASAKNVKKGKNSAESSGGISIKYNNSASFFEELQKNVAASEADANREAGAHKKKQRTA